VDEEAWDHVNMERLFPECYDPTASMNTGAATYGGTRRHVTHEVIERPSVKVSFTEVLCSPKHEVEAHDYPV
jgi:hypothetical protein